MDVAAELIQTSVLERFFLLASKERLAHAYLFVGPQGIGKYETACAAAAMLNCEQGKVQACGTCSSCIKIQAGSHPDIHVLESAFGEAIKIENVRTLMSQLKFRAFMAKKKVFIIQNAENMTLESANALLKTLEEPASDSLLILTTSVPEKILATIRSRCHGIPFHPTPNAELAEHLTKYYHEGSESAHFVAHFAHGCLGKARELQENGLYTRKNQQIDGFIYSSDVTDFIKEVTSDKSKTKEFLDIFHTWMRDAILIKQGIESEKVVHLDRWADLQQFSQRFDFAQLLDIQEHIVQVYKILKDNMNCKLPLMIIKEKLNG